MHALCCRAGMGMAAVQVKPRSCLVAGWFLCEAAVVMHTCPPEGHSYPGWC
jgi:hypothetical protein